MSASGDSEIPDPGSGSLKTAILEVVDVLLLDCFSFVPPALLTSLRFSLTRSLRAPNSGQGVGESAGSRFSDEPDGSTKTCRRALDRDDDEEAIGGVAELVPWAEAERVDRVERVDDDEAVSPSTLRRAVLVVLAVGTDSAGLERCVAALEDIILFWKSLCLLSSRSSGAALRAIPI